MAKNLTAFIFTCVIIIGLLLLAAFGIGSMPGVFDEDGIRKGLDLVGGSLIVYEADIKDGETTENLVDNMESVVSMMRNRLDALGYTEATVTKMGDKRVSIEIPNINDPEEAVQKLGSTAKLEFIDSEGTIVIEGKDIKKASPLYGDPNGSGISQFFVELQLQSDAVQKFSESTLKMSQKPQGENYIAIMLDGKELSKPFVSKEINSDSCVIEGNFDKEKATWLSSVISAGQLPFALKEVQLDSVGPTLGEKALETSIFAGAIGVILVMIYMMIMYRLPGVISSIALIAYMALTGLVLVIFKINLSLPGIAGIILSIGMAVDANVVIFERIKDELTMGKSTKGAVKSGFKRAYTAVLDSNITTLIAAGVLWYFGTGPIRGFAITLFVGVVLSMISAIAVTRFLLTRLVGMNVTNIKLYGVKN